LSRGVALPKYLIGRKIIVVDDGQLYSSYEEMADKFKFKNWVQDNHIRNGVVGKVVNVSAHGDDPYEIILGVVSDKGGEFLIGVRGVEEIETEEQINKSPEYFNIANLIK
jgi:hypothetical protein